MEHEGDGDPIVVGTIWTMTKELMKKTGRLGNKMASSDSPDNNIIKIGQNTEKSPVDLKRLAVT